MIKYHKLTIALLALAVSIILFAIPATATCSHQHLGSETWCEASHPHPYFKFCSDCGEKVYIGGYATKAHGDGSWGSGTCPYCGTHEYIGQTCVTSGTCVCGATGPALGHNFENQVYSEVAHPHYYYRQCLRCGYHYYTGGHATKNHGDGSWGSGTCPDCGTHSYTGQSCTNEGVCACGATIPALGHIAGTSFYHETAHPHKEYSICQRCYGHAYTGQTETRPHGDGTNGTCSSCGIHSLTTQISKESSHPHKTVYKCYCGRFLTTYPIERTCSVCTSNQKTASNSTTRTEYFIYFDSDNPQGTWGGAYIGVVCEFTISYSNTYNHPSRDVTPFILTYNYPNFMSYFSNVTTNGHTSSSDAPPVSVTAGLYTTYYNGSSLIDSQRMNLFSCGFNMTGCTAIDYYPLNTNPSTAKATALCLMSGSTNSCTIETTITFQY